MPPFLTEWLEALAELPISAFLSESTIAYATLNAAHILFIGLLVGSIATLDLRVLGLFRAVPLDALAAPLSRVASAGVLLAIATGLLLFSVRPVAYASNPAFLIKIGLAALGIANAIALRANPNWRVAREGGRMHASIRAGALLSLLIWAGAVLAGRWIGFLQ